MQLVRLLVAVDVKVIIVYLLTEENISSAYQKAVGGAHYILEKTYKTAGWSAVHQLHLENIVSDGLMPYLPHVFVRNQLHFAINVFVNIVVIGTNFQLGNGVAVEVEMQQRVVTTTSRK